MSTTTNAALAIGLTIPPQWPFPPSSVPTKTSSSRCRSCRMTKQRRTCGEHRCACRRASKTDARPRPSTPSARAADAAQHLVVAVEPSVFQARRPTFGSNLQQGGRLSPVRGDESRSNGRKNLLPAGKWLRRAGARHMLESQGTAASEIPLPYPGRSRPWVAAATRHCGMSRPLKGSRNARRHLGLPNSARVHMAWRR
jgi:hypothetical protein